MPRHRIIVALDIESSATPRSDPVKAELRRTMYELFDASLRQAGIQRRDHDPFVDRGDGILALIHPVNEVPEEVLLTRAIPELERLLAKSNASLPRNSRPRRQLRLRVVVHAGEIHYDANGCFGEALDVAFRLLDAAPVKKALRETSDPLVLVISEGIHNSVIGSGYDLTGPQAFRRLVRVQIAGHRYPGWIRIPVTQDATGRVPIPAAALSSVYQALERRVVETGEPYDVEAELAKLKGWISTSRPGSDGRRQLANRPPGSS